MLPSTDDIFTIAQNVFETMVNVVATPESVRAMHPHPTHVSGCIQISGGWQGAVILQTTENFARIIASKMLLIPGPDVTAADMQDCMAEITNMIGGNIKSQVPGPSFLSLPTVTTGADFDFHLAKSHIVNDMALTVEDEYLRIVLCEQDVAVVA